MSKAWPRVRLGEVLRRSELNVSVEAARSYQFAGVYCFGRGVFRGQERIGSQFAYRSLTRLEVGDFVYPKLMAWEGAFGIVPSNCDGCFVSPEFPVFKLRRDQIIPQFLSLFFQLPRVWEEISGKSTGTNIRRRRLNPDDFLHAEIFLPPVVEQRRIVARIEEVAAQINEAQTLRKQSAGEADAISGATASELFHICSQREAVEALSRRRTAARQSRRNISCSRRRRCSGGKVEWRDLPKKWRTRARTISLRCTTQKVPFPQVKSAKESKITSGS